MVMIEEKRSATSWDSSVSQQVILSQREGFKALGSYLSREELFGQLNPFVINALEVGIKNEIRINSHWQLL